MRVELNRFEEAGMLSSDLVGNKKVFQANKEYPLFEEIQKILLKYTGLQDIIDEVIEQLGDLNKVYLTGDLALGKQSDIISLIIVGNPDRHFLIQLIAKVEELIPKKVQYLIYSIEESQSHQFDNERNLVLWHE